MKLTLAGALLASLLNLLIGVLLVATSERLSSASYEPPYTYRVQMRGDFARYYTPAAGRCINWGLPAMAAVAVLLGAARLVDRYLDPSP